MLGLCFSETKYKCINMFGRTEDIIEMQEGNLVDPHEMDEACPRKNMDDDNLPFTTLISKYVNKWEKNKGNQTLCSSWCCPYHSCCVGEKLLMSHAIPDLFKTKAKKFYSAFSCLLLFKLLIIRGIWLIFWNEEITRICVWAESNLGLFQMTMT